MGYQKERLATQIKEWEDLSQRENYLIIVEDLNLDYYRFNDNSYNLKELVDKVFNFTASNSMTQHVTDNTRMQRYQSRMQRILIDHLYSEDKPDPKKIFQLNK